MFYLSVLFKKKCLSSLPIFSFRFNKQEEKFYADVLEFLANDHDDTSIRNRLKNETFTTIRMLAITASKAHRRVSEVQAKRNEMNAEGTNTVVIFS